MGMELEAADNIVVAVEDPSVVGHSIAVADPGMAA